MRKLLILFTIFLFTAGSINAQYCSAEATNTTFEWLSNVTFAGINNNSGSTSYSDFTSIVGTVQQGLTYPFSATVSQTGTDLETVTVWIDWNQDEIFDASERYEIGSCNSSGCIVANNITVPTGAILGNTRMRVILRWSSFETNPCATFTFGEVEDYTINVLTAPTCLPPSALNVSNLAGSSATLNWTLGGAETQWDVYYGATPLTAPDATTTPTQAGVTATNLPISSLTPSTQYAFYVRADCGSGDLSVWAGPFTFTTTQIAATLPFFEGFETWPNSWTVVNGAQTNQWHVGTATAYAGTQSAYISNDNGITNEFSIGSASVVHMYRDVELPAGVNPYNLKFRWKGMGESIYDYLRIYVAPTTFIPLAGTNYTGHLEQYNLQDTWQTTDIELDAATYAGDTWRVIFSWRNDASGGAQPPIAIDDIEIYEITCPKPTALIATDITPNGAILHWAKGAVEDNWNVIVINTATGDTTVQQTVQTDTLLNVSTLANLTDYVFYVQAVCGAGDLSDWTGPYAFTTTVAPLSGNYTINSTQPTAGTNFNSFTDFALYINLGGLAGPVVVDVVAGTGPYTEQVLLGNLNTDVTNTLTINGNGDTLQFLSTNTNARYTLAFNGTDYVTVNDLVIVALGETTSEFGWAVWLSNGADYNTFNNCEFHVNTTSTSLNYAAFVTSNSATSAVTAGVAANNLTIDNCKAIGGYYGIVINGPTSAPFAVNNVVTNTEITDFHLRGLWLRGQNDGLFSGNEISRPTRTNTGEMYMIYLNNNMSGTEISKNKIFDFSSVASTSTANGIYGETVTATVGEELLIANNLIYGLENMNGAQYGMRMLTTNNTLFYHNTISLDNVAHTGASLIRAFHHTGNGFTIDVRNNIFSVTSNSTGTKYCMYFDQTLANIPNLTSDNNVLHMGATAGTNHLVYWNGGGGPNFSTLAAWKAAASNAYDQSSVDVDPLFLDPAAGNLMPLAYGADNIGANLLSVVPDDIYGVARTATPDPGAIEFTIPDYNAAMIEIINPAPSACDMGIETIEVVIKNLGMIPITSIEAGYIVDGGTPVTEVFSGLNILIDEVDTLAFTAGFDFSALGVYSITAFTNLTGDTLNLNDTLSGYLVRNGHDFAAGDYFMGFENTEYSADWTIIDIGNNGGWQVPHSSTAFANTGSFSAFFNNATGNTDDDWLFSRCFTFEQGETYELSFFYRSSSATVLSNMNIYLMDAVSETATPISTIIELHDFTGTAFQQAVERFSVPTTGTYYIAWENFSDPSTTNNSIDDINITLVPGADAAVVEITKPLGACDMGNEFVEIVIVNVGAQPITTAFDVSYQLIGSSTVVTENIATPNIAVFDTLVYQFTTPADFSTTMDSIFEIMAWVSLTGDPIADNDTAWHNVLSGYIPVFQELINDTVPYGGFATLNAVSAGNVYWYDDILGTNLIHEGAVYVTDSIFNDTTFYVMAKSESFDNVGKPIYNVTDNTSSSGYGLVFNVVDNDVTIYSVDVFSVGSGGQMNVELRSSTGALIESLGPFTYPAGSTANPVRVTFPLNLDVPVGTGYRLLSASMSGNLVREFSANNNFPYESSNGNVVINGGYLSGLNQTYYWFYNWVVSSGSGCETALEPISAILETPACYFITDVTIDTIAQDYVALYWTQAGTETQWEIEYGHTGFTLGTGMTHMANATTDTIFGLNHSTSYEFYIRSFCDPNYSLWTGPYHFFTGCGIVDVFPWNEQFDDAVQPDDFRCWMTMGEGGETWYVADFNPQSGTQYAAIDYDDVVTQEEYLVTPQLDFTALTQPYVSFWWSMSYYWGVDPFDNYDVYLLVTTDNGVTVDTLWSENDEGVFASWTWYETHIDLTAYAAEPNVQIGFLYAGYDGAALYLDNITVGEQPSCDAITALVADNITPFEAELSWTGGHDVWEIEWDTLGFTQGDGHIVVTNDNPYLLAGLTPETEYEFYVRAYCMFDTTAWEGPLAFATPATCVVPDSLDTISVTHEAAIIAWTSPDTLWMIEWDTAGFVLGTGNVVITSDNPYTITGLDELTTYDVYIRALCDTVNGDSSYWVGPLTFTTTTTIGIGTIITDMDINIYPNPSNGLINIQMLADFETVELTIMNIQGQIIYSEKLSGLVNGSIKQMELNIASGLYFIRLSSGTQVSTNKLIIN